VEKKKTELRKKGSETLRREGTRRAEIVRRKERATVAEGGKIIAKMRERHSPTKGAGLTKTEKKDGDERGLQREGKKSR